MRSAVLRESSPSATTRPRRGARFLARLAAFPAHRKLRGTAMSMSEKTALELNQELAHELTGERGHTITAIFLIAEIEQKQLFVELGYGSMWDFLSRMHKQSNTMIHYRL